LVATSLQGEPFTGVWRIKETNYQVAIAPVRLGDTVIGTILSGFQITPPMLESWSIMLGCEVGLVSPHDVVGQPGLHAFLTMLQQELATTPSELLTDVFIRSFQRQRFMISVVPVGGAKLVYVLARPIDKELKQMYVPLRRALLGIGAILFVLALSVSMVFAGRLTKPISELVAGTKRIAAGDFDSKVAVVSRDELGELASTFNDMVNQLKGLLQKEKELAATAAAAEAEKKRAVELERAYRQLQQKTMDLERFQRLTVGRELEMVKLKEEINTLLQQLGQPKKYEAPEKITHRVVVEP
jgi:methyl-accepting chemotaxis protein